MKHAVLLFLVLLLCLGLTAATHHARGIFAPGLKTPLNTRGYHILDYTTSYFDGNTWQLSGKHVFHYNAQLPARIDSLEIFYWDYDLLEFVKEEVYILGYNAWGSVSSVQNYYCWDGTYTFEGRSEYDYDTQHRLIRIVWYEVNDSREEYVQGRTHFIYSGAQLDKVIDYNWDSWDEEAYYYETEFDSDNQGRIISDLESESPDSLNWTANWQVSYAYHPNDTSTVDDLIELISYIYSISDDLILIGMPFMWSQRIDQEWNGSGWDNADRYTYTWQTPENRLTMELEEEWDTGAWANTYQNTLTYDANGNCAWLMGWEWMDTRAWQESSRTQFTWGNYVANDDPVLPAPEALKLKAWPLPFATEVNLMAESAKSGEAEITVYNLKGQVLRKLSGIANTSLTWDGRDMAGHSCASGIYFLKATLGRQTCTERILKLK